MKQLMMSLVACVGFSLIASAKEITWTGAVDTDFATEGNWSGGAPAAGDVAKFTKNATITGSFDFGADGITLDVSGCTLTCKTAFAGTGRLTKTGTGQLDFAQQNTGSFTGGLRMEGGALRTHWHGNWSTYIGGTGNVIELVMQGLSTDPYIEMPD